VRHLSHARLQENKEALTIAEVQAKVDYFRNELDANFAVNGHVVDQYKRRLETVSTRFSVHKAVHIQINALDCPTGNEGGDLQAEPR
jgi:hypothetical protein